MSILAFLASSWVGELISSILGFLKKRAALREAAQQEMVDDVQAHARDGEASVELRDSYQRQIAELKAQLEAERAANQTKPVNPVQQNEPRPAMETKT